MDFFDRAILKSLNGHSSRNFKEILTETGVSHNTLKRHLNHMLARGLILRDKLAQKRRGRPEFCYCLTPKFEKRIRHTLEEPFTSLVTLTFTKLKQICKHNKGGYCKTNKRNCSPYTCSHIIRGE